MNETQNNYSMFNHNNITVLSPVLRIGSGLTAFLVLLFLAVFWIKFPTQFYDAVHEVVLDGWFAMKVLFFLAVASIVVFLLSKFFGALVSIVDGVHNVFTKNKVHYAGEHYALYSGNMVVHDHKEERTNYSVKVNEVNASEQQASIEAPKVNVPTARELLTNGTLQDIVLTKNLVFIGFTLVNNVLEPLTLEVDNFYSCIIGGIGGAGKTVTAFWLLVQEIMAGTKLIVIDPHLYTRKRNGETDSLGQRLMLFKSALLFEPIDNEDSAEIMRRMRWMDAELQRRKKRGFDLRSVPNVMAVFDEFNTVIEDEEIRNELGDILARIQREGRKLGLHTMILGHKFAAQDIGNIKIRTSASNVLAHRYNDENQAKVLLGSDGKKCLNVTQGSYWLRGLMTGDLQQVWTPKITEHEIPLVLDIMGETTTLPDTPYVEADPYSQPISDPYPTHIQEQNDGYGFERPVETIDSADMATHIQLTHAQKAKVIMVMDMDSNQASQGEIIKAVWEVEPNSRQGQEVAKGELRLLRAFIAEQARKAVKL